MAEQKTYLAQKYANSFPSWSAIRNDPSSLGQRLLAAASIVKENSDIVHQRVSRNSAFGRSYFFPDHYLRVNLDPEIDLEKQIAAGTVSIVAEDTLGNDIVLNVAENPSALFYPLLEDFIPDYVTFKDLMNEPKIIRARKIWEQEGILPHQLTAAYDNYRGTLAVFHSKPLQVHQSREEFRISIKVSNGTHYNEDANESSVMISGYGIDNEFKTEIIKIRDDGVYESRELWTHFGELLPPEMGGRDAHRASPFKVAGFTALVEIFATGTHIFNLFSPFHSTAVPENSFLDLEGDITLSQDDDAFTYKQKKNILDDTTPVGPVQIDLSSNEFLSDLAPSNDFSVLDSYLSLFYQGNSYRREDLDNQDLLDESKELIASQLVLDALGEPIKIVDFAFNYLNGRLYGLELTPESEISPGKIHEFSLGLHIFDPPALKRTRSVNITLKPLHHRVEYGERLQIWTHHQILRSPIYSVSIMRESPSQYAEGTLFRGEYLQGDMTWSDSPYEFSGTPSEEMPEKSWQDFSFFTDFDGDIDETLGQWNFYCEVKSLGAAGNDYAELERRYSEQLLDPNDEQKNKELYWDMKERMLMSEFMEVTRYSTAVFCEYIKADSSATIPLLAQGHLNGFEILPDEDPDSDVLNEPYLDPDVVGLEIINDTFNLLCTSPGPDAAGQDDWRALREEVIYGPFEQRKENFSAEDHLGRQWFSHSTTFGMFRVPLTPIYRGIFPDYRGDNFENNDGFYISGTGITRIKVTYLPDGEEDSVEHVIDVEGF